MDRDDYSRQYAAQYGGREWFETALVAVRRKRVLESIARHPHRRILEVGCGLEPLFVDVAEAERFVVVEPCAPFAARARELAQGRPGIEVVEAFLEGAAPTDETFDLIVVSSLLHEVERPEALLAAVRARCHAETVVHFNVPNVRSFHRLLALEMGLIGDLFEASEIERRFQRHTRYDRERFCEALGRAGFDVLRFETYFIKPFSHRQMERIVGDGILDHSAIAALDAMTRYMPDLGAEMYAEVRRTR